jgi:hypothetical protein
MNKSNLLKLRNRGLIFRDHVVAGADSDGDGYMFGYLRGLSRALHGDVYGIQDHERFISYATLDPEKSEERRKHMIGLGYRDGLAARSISASILQRYELSFDEVN